MATQSLPTPAELEAAEERLGDVVDIVDRLMRRIDDAILVSADAPPITPAYVGYTFSFWEQIRFVSGSLVQALEDLTETMSELNLERGSQEARGNA